MQRILPITVLLFLSLFSFGVIKTFTGPGNFSDPSKWNSGTLPVAGDDLRINGSCAFDNAANNFAYLTLNVGNTLAGSLLWPVGGTNTLNVTSVSSSVTGSSINMAKGGTLQIRNSWSTTNQTFSPGVGTINWNVSAANSTLPAGIATYYNLIITAGSSIVTLGAATSVNNNITINTGTFRTSGINFTCNGTVFVSGTLNDNNIGGTNTLNNITINAGGIMDNSVNETYELSGNFTMLGGNIVGSGKPTFNIAGNLLVLAGTNNMGEAQVTVTLNTSVSGTFVCNSTFGKKIINDFIVTSTGNFNCPVAENWKINGNMQFNGVANPGLGKYVLQGLNKTISGTSPIIFDDITCNGSYTNNLNLTVTSTLKGNGTWTQGSTGTLNLSILDANFTTTTFNASASGNTVNYSLAGAQSVRIPSDGSYSNLTASGSGIKSLLANTIAKGNIVISSTLSATASNFNLSVGGNWTNNGGTFTPGTAIVTFSSALAQSISKTGGETFNHLAFSGAGVKTFSSAITANGNFSVNTAAPVDVSASNNQLTIKGNFINNGTLNARTGLVHFNGSAAQTIGGTSVTNFNDITLGNAAGASLTSAQNLLGALTLTTGVFNTNSQVFTMVSTASACARIAPIISPGNISGNVTVQRFAPAGTTGWALFGTPISSPLTFADWNDDFGITCPTCPDGFPGSFYSIYSYNETVPGLYDAPASYVAAGNITDPIVQNKGYWVYFGNGQYTTTDIIVDVTGTVRKFNNTIPLNYTNFGSPINDGWNLIHNPYPSPISWSALKGATSNIDNAIYVYNADLNAGAGGFATYVNGISSPAVGSGGVGNTIPMSQAFFVHSTGATALTAQESNKVAGNPTYLKTNVINNSPGPLVRIVLDGIYGFNDETVLYLQALATDTFDEGFDSYKMRGQDPYAPTIALEKGTDQFQVNGVAPISGNFSMPLKTLTGYPGTYTISASSFSSFPHGACISLYDKFLNVTTDISTTPYVFNLSDTTTVARFDLNITMLPLLVNTSVTQPSCQLLNNGKVVASGTSTGPWNYYWTNNGTPIQTSLNKTTADTLSNLSGGTFDLEVNTVGMCDNSSTSYQINTQVISYAHFISVDTLDLNLFPSITFANLSSGAVSYLWNFGDGSGTTTNASPTYYYPFPGTYTVTLICWSSSGCSDTTTKVITVISSLADLALNGINASELIVKTKSDNEFIFERMFNEEHSLTFRLTDTWGRLIQDYGTITTKAVQLPVDLKSFSPGIYLMTITTGNSKKVVKLPVK